MFVHGSHAAVEELVARDATLHGVPGTGDAWVNLRAAIERTSAGLADVEMVVQDLIAEGDLVAARITSSATQVGPFMGLPPTGRRYTIGELHLFRLRDDRIVEHWHQLDAMGLMRQLGVAPPRSG